MEGVDGCKLFPQKKVYIFVVKMLFKTMRTFHFL
jgi:hypothetical protein